MAELPASQFPQRFVSVPLQVTPKALTGAWGTSLLIGAAGESARLICALPLHRTPQLPGCGACICSQPALQPLQGMHLLGCLSALNISGHSVAIRSSTPATTKCPLPPSRYEEEAVVYNKLDQLNEPYHMPRMYSAAKDLDEGC